MEVMNRGHYEIAMRVLLFILGVFAVIVSIEKPAEARRGAWCANYNMGGGATNCGFATFSTMYGRCQRGWRDPARTSRPIRDIRRNPLDLIAGERVELMTSASGFVISHSGSGKNGACVSNGYCDQLAYAARGRRL
jgi:hypothetical protein